MKKLWMPLFALITLLGACAPAFDQPKQLQDAAHTALTQVARETAAIDTIQAQVGAFPAAFEKAYAKNPDADFQNTGAVHAVLVKRDAAYKRLEDAQEKLEAATNRLVKLNSQANPKLPKAELRQVLATLKLAKLDHKTFDAYYKELTAAEQDFFDTVATTDDHAGIESALSQLNQYDSSLSQQADIVSANLQSVTADAKTLHQAAKAME